MPKGNSAQRYSVYHGPYGRESVHLGNKSVRMLVCVFLYRHSVLSTGRTLATNRYTPYPPQVRIISGDAFKEPCLHLKWCWSGARN
jgi:hypothetical protein